MYRIGEFSKLCQVTVKTLRFYDEVGLFKPANIDPVTGYRSYSADQLPRLNRILALKDLGLSLEQIARLLDERMSAAEMRGMFRLKQAELQEKIADEQTRLARVEARLKQIDQEESLPDYDVVIKRIVGQTIIAVHEVIPNYESVRQLFGKLFAQISQHRLKPAGPMLAIYYDPEYREHDVDMEAAIPIEVPPNDIQSIPVRTLPGVEAMACVVHKGSYDTVGESYVALMGWIGANGYHIVGPNREMYLRGPESGDAPELFVTEVQFPVEKG